MLFMSPSLVAYVGSRRVHQTDVCSLQSTYVELIDPDTMLLYPFQAFALSEVFRRDGATSDDKRIRIVLPFQHLRLIASDQPESAFNHVLNVGM